MYEAMITKFNIAPWRYTEARNLLSIRNLAHKSSKKALTSLTFPDELQLINNLLSVFVRDEASQHRVP